MNKRWLIGLSLLVALALLMSGCDNKPTAEEIVTKMQEVEASIEDAHAIVEFSIQTPEMEADVVVEMWEKRPDKLRAEVIETDDETFAGIVSVTDGQQGWIYHPGENEVVMGDLAELEMEGMTNPRQAIQLMEEGIQWVLDNSDVERVGEEDLNGVPTYILEFTPRDDAETELPINGKGTLWVDQERWIALQAHFSGDLVGEGLMRVRSLDMNLGVSDERFQFEIPEGADVIDAADLKPKPLTLDEARDKAEFPLLVPGYLPEGTTLVEVFEAQGGFVLYYDHSETSFTVVQGVAEAINETPGGETSEVTVRGQTATLVTDGQGHSFLAWTENGVTVAIVGHISQDEVLQVAESLE
jgi:outer membrane lipoprotein-sorting protein